MANRICVLLSGCGAFDGSDLHEAVLTQLALERTGAKVFFASPDITQHHVMDHATQEEQEEQRHVLVESARIARGNIVDAAALDSRQFDALIIPGGFGALKNLSDVALKGPPHNIDSNIKHILSNMHADHKPIGAIGMAVVLLVVALRGNCLDVTIGEDQGLATAIEAMGCRHQSSRPGQICVDAPHKIVTTPAYKVEAGIDSLAEGIERMAQKIIDLIG